MPEQANGTAGEVPVVAKIEIDLLADGNIVARAANVSIQQVFMMVQTAQYKIVKALEQKQEGPKLAKPPLNFDPKKLRG